MNIRKLLIPIILLITMMAMGCGGGLALTKASVDSAQKIYYAPLMMNRYIVRPVYRIPQPTEEAKGLSKIAVAKKQLEVQKGVADNYRAVDMWTDFAVGDTGRVGKDLVIIAGVIPKAVIDDYNSSMLAKLQEVLGNKVQSWPEGQFMLEKMDMRGNLYDFGNSDADMYIYTSPPASREPVMISIPDVFVELPKADPLDRSRYNHTLYSNGNTNSITLFMRNPEDGKMKKAISVGFAVFVAADSLTYELFPSGKKIDLTKAYAEIPDLTQAAASQLADKVVNVFTSNILANRDRFFRKLVLQ